MTLPQNIRELPFVCNFSYNPKTSATPAYKYFAEQIGNGCEYVEQIGNGCEYVEQVRIGDGKKRRRFVDFVMLVDDSGLYRDGAKINARASFLYGMHIHGQPIMGNVILVGVRMDPLEGEEWCDLPEHVTLEAIDRYCAAGDSSGLFL